jgi:hypothetical protein
MAAALLAAAPLLTGCGGPTPPVPGANGDHNPDGPPVEIGSYSVMADWTGCEVLDDLAPLKEFMGVTHWGDNGLTSLDIPSGMDGEAYSCIAFLAGLPAYTSVSDVTGTRIWEGTANIDVSVAPWDSPEEAEQNFTERVDQYLWALETGGTEYTDVTEGEIAGDWDQSYRYTGTSSTSFVFRAIVRTGDLVFYIFIDYTHDPGVQHETGAVYPFTNEELTAWALDEYLPAVRDDVLAQKDAATA